MKTPRRESALLLIAASLVACLKTILPSATAAFSTSHVSFLPRSSPPLSRPIKKKYGSASVSLSASAGGSAETEAEALLRKARELRAQAEAEEKTFHDTLLEKKKRENAEIDSVIDGTLFPANASDGLLDRLRRDRPPTDTLVRAVERLHEKEIAAKGFAHVEPTTDGGDNVVTFDVVALPDEDEVARLEGLIEELVAAATVLDEEFLSREGGEGSVMHADKEHYTHGELSNILSDRIKCLRREHDDQFKKRQGEFYEAARIKKHRNEVEDTGAKL